MDYGYVYTQAFSSVLDRKGIRIMRRLAKASLAVVFAQAMAAQVHALGEQSASHGIAAHRDIDYIIGAEYAAGRDRLDVFMPAEISDAPVIVFLHGGGLLIGDKSQGLSLAESLVPRGIGVVATNYRLSPGVSHPAHVQDAAAAFAWTIKHIENYGGDPKRVYLAGHSAGAYMATLLALDDSYLHELGLSESSVRGMIAISPFLYVEEVAPDRPKSVWGSDTSTWRQASPTSHVGSWRPPLLFVYADRDAEWRRDQIKRAVAVLESAGQERVEMVEIQDRDHLSIIEKLVEGDDLASSRIADFVLRPKDTMK